MIQIKAMDQSYLPPTCLHNGPIDPAAKPDVCMVGQDGVPAHPWADEVLTDLAAKHGDLTCSPWKAANHEFYREMTQRHGACQMLAWEDGRVVGMLPFFPVTVLSLLKPSWFAPEAFGIERPADMVGTLMVRCVMTSRPYFGGQGTASRAYIGNNPTSTPEEAGARRGVGRMLVSSLTEWAQEHGWKRILANAHADIDYAYGMYGCGGKAFWEKAGFRAVGSERRPTPDNNQWRAIVETQAKEKGMTADEAWTWYQMVYDVPTR